MLKMEHFYYMIEIAKTGTINKAAEHLYISQPYLSLSLKEIESVLGVTLFNRTNKGVTLTAAGEKFLEYSNQIVSIVNKANNLKNLCPPKQQRLSIVSMPSFTMIDLFQNFSMSHTDSSQYISYEELPNETVTERLLKGHTNIGFFYIPSTIFAETIKELASQGLTFTPLVDEPVYAVVSSQNSLANQGTVCLKDLNDLEFLVESIKLPNKNSPVENNPFPEIFRSRQADGLKFNNNRSMLYYLTKCPNCFCIGQKSLNLTNPFVQAGLLKYLPIIDVGPSLITGYITNDFFNSSLLEEEFIDFVEAFFDNYSQTDSFSLAEPLL